MSKPDVLFVHGAGGGAWEWNVWMRVFKAHGFHCHAPDLLPSPEGLADTSLEDYREQVHLHLRLMTSPKIMVGASLGGLLALMNAENADAVVLINPIPPAPWQVQMPTCKNYLQIIPWRTRASLRGTRQALPDCDEATCLYAFRHWRDESAAVMNTAMAGVEAPQPDCPVLVMASELDSDIPIALAKDFASSLNASFIHLSGASHVGPLLGRRAVQYALQAVAYLNQQLR